MTITLGPRLIGKEAADKAARALTDNEGGGAIQLGDKVFSGNEKFRKRALAQGGIAVAPVPVVPELVVLPPVPRVTANRVPVAPQPPAPAPEPAGALSEAEVELLLAADPNAWDKVCELETARPEGFRPAIAHMVLNAAPEAQENPIPEAVLAVLRATVADSDKADEATMRAAAAVAAGESVTALPPEGVAAGSVRLSSE